VSSCKTGESAENDRSFGSEEGFIYGEMGNGYRYKEMYWVLGLQHSLYTGALLATQHFVEPGLDWRIREVPNG
jgi:hypothetical protein